MALGGSKLFSIQDKAFYCDLAQARSFKAGSGDAFFLIACNWGMALHDDVVKELQFDGLLPRRDTIPEDETISEETNEEQDTPRPFQNRTH